MVGGWSWGLGGSSGTCLSEEPVFEGVSRPRWWLDAVSRSLFDRSLRACSGELPGSLVVEAEIDHASQVDGCHAHGQTELVGLDAAEADATVGSADEPGDGSFDHRSPLSVGTAARFGDI